MKYVLDENLQGNDDDLPDNMINAGELYFRNGLRQQGISDQKLLNLATQEGYIIITQDLQLVTIANQKNIDIIYAFGRAGWQWHFISKDLNLFDRGRLRRFVQVDTYKYKKETVVVKNISELPHYLKGYVKPAKKKKKILKIGDSNKINMNEELKPFYSKGKIDLKNNKFFEGMKKNYDGVQKN